jgi:hypothetical protein
MKRRNFYSFWGKRHQPFEILTKFEIHEPSYTETAPYIATLLYLLVRCLSFFPGLPMLYNGPHVFIKPEQQTNKQELLSNLLNSKVKKLSVLLSDSFLNGWIANEYIWSSGSYLNDVKLWPNLFCLIASYRSLRRFHVLISSFPLGVQICQVIAEHGVK